MSTECEHVWEPGPLGYKSDLIGGQLAHQKCGQCGEERWAPVKEPEKPTASDGKICPLRNFVVQGQHVDSECEGKGCAWWDADDDACAILLLAGQIESTWLAVKALRD